MTFAPCELCGRIKTKRLDESKKRYSTTRFCSQRCQKEWFRSHEIGWFARGVNRIDLTEGKKKKEVDVLTPVLWEKRDFDIFYASYPELSIFLTLINTKNAPSSFSLIPASAQSSNPILNNSSIFWYSIGFL